MRPIKKYDDGGDIPLNKKHLKLIRKKAKKAYMLGDKEKGDKLTARADKKEARQKKWYDRVERFIANQQAAEAKAEARKARNPFASMDAAMDEIERKLDAEKRDKLANIKTPNPYSKSATTSKRGTTPRYKTK